MGNLSKKISLVVVLLTSLVSLSISGCAKENPPISKSEEFEQFPKDSNSVSAGVVVYRYGEKGGWIENSNDFPVQIHRNDMFIGMNHVEWIFTFQPGQVRKLYYIPYHIYFHIYDMEGKQIGFIVPRKPK